MKGNNRAAIAYIKDNKDRLLMGKRNDSGKFTNPGGHLHEGECPYEGMVRELKEESGLDAKELKLLKVAKKGNCLVYLFEVKIDPNQKIDPSNDPDKECNSWSYIDPYIVRNKLHIPIKDNWAIDKWLE